jgi:hypothetical protein
MAWLEKQGKNIPSRNMILAVWELGNEWKELTNGRISKEYGTQLEYIQKHWNESQYYLRDKQGEQKPADKVEPKFKVGDCIRHKGADECYRIVTINDNYYFCENNHAWNISSQDYFELVEQKPAWSEEDEEKIDLLIAIFEVNHLNEYFKANPINTLNMKAVSTEEIVDWLESLKDRMKGE